LIVAARTIGNALPFWRAALTDTGPIDGQYLGALRVWRRSRASSSCPN